jgi:hypothetical protein
MWPFKSKQKRKEEPKIITPGPSSSSESNDDWMMNPANPASLLSPLNPIYSPDNLGGGTGASDYSSPHNAGLDSGSSTNLDSSSSFDSGSGGSDSSGASGSW